MTYKRYSSNAGCDSILSDGNLQLRLEITSGLRSTRDLRAKMLGVMFDLVKSHEEENISEISTVSVLILINPEIGREKLEEEWHFFLLSVSQRYHRNLVLLEYLDGELQSVSPHSRYQEDGYDSVYESNCLPSHLLEEIKEIIKEESKPKNGRLPQTDYKHTLTTLLIKNYFEKSLFLKSKALQIDATCSYPTLQRVLKNLEPWIERDSARSLRLKQFPNDIWWKLLSNATTARHTVHFQDISGQPRSIESLLKRVKKLDSKDIAVGGVAAALHHYPKLDIVGSPRLDLIVHVRPHSMNRLSKMQSATEIATHIDPGLEETSDPTKPVRLAVHYLRRRESCFTHSAKHEYWVADEVESLYDLHDARLTPQAEQLLNHLKRSNS